MEIEGVVKVAGSVSGLDEDESPVKRVRVRISGCNETYQERRNLQPVQRKPLAAPWAENPHGQAQH